MEPLRIQAKRVAPEPSTHQSQTSKPDIAQLAERFEEPLRGEHPSAPSRPAAAEAVFKPRLVVSDERPAPPRAEISVAPRPAAPQNEPAIRSKRRLPRRALIAGAALAALVPLGLLFVQLWPDLIQPGSDGASSAPSVATAAPKQGAAKLEVALSSPRRIEANPGATVAFPIAIDATGPLPARSIVAVSALPQGASFSDGRPYGVTGWSLRPDEIAGLRLRLPAQTGASDMRLELVAADGTVLSQAETRVNIGATPPQVATTDDPLAAGFVPLEQMAAEGAADTAPAASVAPVAVADASDATAEAPPSPRRKPEIAAGDESAPKVNTVKVVSVKPPREAKPHDGGYGLGPATEEPQASAEWMETKTAVDMHAKAQQSSETVKVAQGGLKVQVKARDNRWIQVTDPKTSTTGWIYDRFLKASDAPKD